MGSYEGTIKVAASRIGITVQEHKARPSSFLLFDNLLGRYAAMGCSPFFFSPPIHPS